MKLKSLFVIAAAALLIVSCGGKSQTQAQVQQPEQAAQAPVVAQEAPTEEVMAEAAPVVEQPAAQEPASSGGTVTYTAPDNLFTMDVPASWSAAKDTSTIEDSEIDTYTAPDGNAFVQALVNKITPDTSAVLKAQYTRDYMKRLYGSDLRFATDVTLKDGREKLEWWSDMNKTSGTTYFNTKDGYLYFTTVGYGNAYENDYQNVLQQVVDSYSE
jgi:hypothetical protein